MKITGVYTKSSNIASWTPIYNNTVEIITSADH